MKKRFFHDRVVRFEEDLHEDGLGVRREDVCTVCRQEVVPHVGEPGEQNDVDDGGAVDDKASDFKEAFPVFDDISLR